MKYIFRLSSLIIICVLFQTAYLIMLVLALDGLSPYLHIIMLAISIITALFIATGENNATYKLAWIIPILLFPSVFGILYLFYNRPSLGMKIENELLSSEKSAKLFLPEVLENKEKKLSKTDFVISEYIKNACGAEITFSDECQYFKDGKSFLDIFLQQLQEAENYIFIEFFIIEQGKMWNTILTILQEKARQGLDIRVIYDGYGSLLTLPYNYYKKLRKSGIKCMVFNPLRPFLSIRFNVHNHRKIAVIDGKVAFNGGLNLADEYINEKENAKTGFWKDTAVMIKGDNAWNFTLMFLSMWEFLSREKVVYEKMLPFNKKSAKNIDEIKSGICVWRDIPLDTEPLSERLFLSLIHRAENYIYIISPYLVPSNETIAALCISARSGIDVKLILPFIPDKFLIHTVTKTNYPVLLKAGVKIYEYAPGFIHGKNVVSDDTRAMVSTANLDYRSMYMHHECGSCFFGGKIIYDIKLDFLETLKSCKEITLPEYLGTGIFKQGFRRVCRLLTPFI